jgi:hypothetical protein
MGRRTWRSNGVLSPLLCLTGDPGQLVRQAEDTEPESLHKTPIANADMKDAAANEPLHPLDFAHTRVTKQGEAQLRRALLQLGFDGVKQ